jgi:hypothetical protein
MGLKESGFNILFWVDSKIETIQSQVLRKSSVEIAKQSYHPLETCANEIADVFEGDKSIETTDSDRRLLISKPI